MNKHIKITLAALTAACVIPSFAGCAPKAENEDVSRETSVEEKQENQSYEISESSTSYEVKESDGESRKGSDAVVTEDGSYTSMEEVSAYIHEFGHLPDNYITKSEAKNLGWKSSEGNLTIVAPGKSIGGDNFSNREGQLPKQSGRKYYECDIDYTGGTRNSKRIVYSNDGLIFYTEDHYNTFEQLY